MHPAMPLTPETNHNKSRRLSSAAKSVVSDAGLEDWMEDNDDAKEKMQRRRSMRKSLKFGANIKLENADEPQIKNVLENYSTVLKLCSENKVNTKNTWSLNLIDHIEDILATQRGSFQKASCTLQASVQIYEKRVDATLQDTFKMLENVNRTSNRGANDGEEDRKRMRKSGKDKKGTGATSSTLESNLNNITQRKLDREFEVDPLFKKMSQAFDEGGARGMLLNQLGVHSGCRIVFDTSDTPAMVHRNTDNSPNDSTEERSIPTVDLGDNLKRKMDTLFSKAKHAKLAPSLDELYRHIDSDGSMAMHSLSLQDKPEKNDDAGSYYADDDYDDDDDGGGFAGGFDDYDSGDEDAGGAGVDEWVSAQQQRAKESQEAAKTDGTKLSGIAASNLAIDNIFGGTAKGGSLELRFLEDGPESDYSFFSKGQNWAGPSHWKFVQNKPKASSGNPTKRTTTAASKKKKAKFLINFSEALGDVDWDAKFAPPPRSKTSTLLPKSVREASVEDGAKANSLPDDVRFQVRELRRLFLKPRTFLLGHGDAGFGASGNLRIATSSFKPDLNHMSKLANTFGATYGDDDDDDYYSDDDGGVGGMGFDDDGNDGGNGGGFMSDDDDGYDFDPAQGVELIGQGRVVGKIDIAYEKRAKKVDVKLLKRNLWDHIQVNAPKLPEEKHGEESENEDASGDDDDDMEHDAENESIHNIDKPLDDEPKKHAAGINEEAHEKLQFTESIGSLAPKVASEITVPFYFICVLHLANEKGLELNGESDLSDFAIAMDPNAKPAC